MKGWLLVGPQGTKGNQLDDWFERALNFVKALPAK